MLISIVLIMLIASGGFALSYLIEADEPFMWRAAAGMVIGCAIYGTLAFLIGSFSGLQIASPIALVLTLSPLLLFTSRDRRRRFNLDWQRATNKMQGGSAKTFLRFAFYAFFLLLFCIFFSQAMYQTPQGIFTGGSNNLGDLPFHLGAIFGFTDGANLPPQNPSFAGAKFSYPFIADLATAGFMELGADVINAMYVQNVAWAFSLLVVLERFVVRLTGDGLAGRLAPWLLFFSGGLGFIWFFQEYWYQGRGFFEFLNSLPKDYTIGNDYRWGNSLITLFITQRSLLLGMPLTIVVLERLWEWFTSEKVREGKSEKVRDGWQSFYTFSRFHFAPFLLGLIAGMLPLVHLHSLAVLFIVTVFLLGLNPENWKTWIAFGIGVVVIAVPELAWSIMGSATHATEFFDWHFGWDKGDANIFTFWLVNTGLVIPLICVGLFIYFRGRRNGSSDEIKNGKYKLWLFYTPFLFCFVVANAAKLAPWEWDNIKVLIYWYVGSLPLIGLALAWIWHKGAGAKVVAAGCFIVLIFSGVLDVYRTSSGQIKTRVFDIDAIHIADEIKRKTPPHALFLNAATYNTAVALTGRESLMRYPGHLSSHGIDYRGREADVKAIYQGGPAADPLLAKYGIDYVLISQEELRSMNVNQNYFSKYPVVAEAGSARVYKIR
jgi:hypothetical protein